MKPPTHSRALALLAVSVVFVHTQIVRKITTPKEALGFNIGDDYRLATYTQLESYWKKLATESDRIKLVDTGLTAEGRNQWMANITSPENDKNLARYQEIAQKLVQAEGGSGAGAPPLAGEGKDVLLSAGGLG